MEKQLDLQLNQAARGRQLWLSLIETHNLGTQDYVILFPNSQEEVNYYGLLYLNQFIQAQKANQVIIVTNDLSVYETYDQFTCNVKYSSLLSDEEIDSLLWFYRLYKFTDKLIIVSLDRLPGRTLSHVQNVRGITLEELISIGIYQLREFKQEQPVKYDGKRGD